MIVFPDEVVPNNIIPALIDFGGVQRPPLGGKILRINRLGNRYRASVSLPPIPSVDLGRIVVSRLLKAKTQGLRIDFPLCGVDQGEPGSPLVKGANQAGGSIIMDGFAPGYVMREGYWFSVVTNSQHYLYNVAADAVADGSGNVTVPIVPWLRRPPADNDVVYVIQPMLEGLVAGDEQRWNYSLAHHLNIEFEIEEAE
jgi:hypothetical protein